MKFLLTAINAKYIHSNPAIYSLRAYAGEELRQSIELAEYTINQPVQEILADIYRREPDAIGFFLLYLELETGAGTAGGASQGAAPHADLAGRSGGILRRG